MRGNNGMNSDPESLQAFEALLEESLAVHPEAEARVLDRLSIGLQKVTVYKPAARETADLWQHALKTAVMIALAVGLFAMVGRREHSTSIRVSVGEDGGEEKKVVRPKPDDTQPPPKPENMDKTRDETHDKAWLNGWKKRSATEDKPKEDARVEGSTLSEEPLSADLLDVDRAAAPPAPSEKTIDGCELNLSSYYGQDELKPKNHYVVVPSAFKIASESATGITHTQAGIVIAFCRRGCHEGFRHVLLSNRQIVTVQTDNELRKLFKHTAEKLHMDLTPTLALDDAKLKLLVEALGDNDFTVREEATATLSKVGVAAIKALEAGARSDDVERSSRCKTLLKTIKPASEVRLELGLDK